MQAVERATPKITDEDERRSRALQAVARRLKGHAVCNVNAVAELTTKKRQTVSIRIHQQRVAHQEAQPRAKVPCSLQIGSVNSMQKCP
jgi:hypothetical protein